MGITQKYSLKWNDFTVNVASTFRDLHARQDFVDVTLACADGSTLEAHKVVLSSVSSYFRDILKQTPCKHPIIILKDTPRDEASAMLEFAYTGEVNVAQELLPALLHTARAFRIKGLDKVESPVADQPAAAGSDPAASNPVLPPPPRWELAGHPAATPPDESVMKTQSGGEHFLAATAAATADKIPSAANPVLNVNGRREREVSPPPAHSRPGSRPPTRESSPCPTNGSSNSARTPPPKRWKRSFDMSGAVVSAAAADMRSQQQPQQEPKTEPDAQQPLPMIAENYSTNRPDFEPSKRYNCDSNSNGATAEPSTAAADRRSLPYPHSMPTSPTMFERGNESRLAGLFRHHLANTTSNGGAATVVVDGRGAPVAAHSSQRPDSTAAAQENGNGSASNGGSDDALDYSRCYSNSQSKSSSQSESDYSNARNGHATAAATAQPQPAHPPQQPQPSTEAAVAAAEAAAAEAAERYRRSSLSVFRPESAPTVLDMSPENSLSGPPSSLKGGNVDLIDRHATNGNGEMDPDQSLGPDDIDCVTGKPYSLTPDAMGRYNCDECGKFFKHPGSLQHHRHIHRGTHRCPSCGKAFSRRWDMERHLNKSKYGCPANRFSTGSAGSSGSSSGGGGGAGGNLALAAAAAAAAAAANGQSPGQSHIEMLAAASSVAAAAAQQQQSVSVHNTTA